MTIFNCKILQSHSKTQARVTEITTAHGTFYTPTFMPVGTYAGVNNMLPNELKQAGTQILLGGNTYHMLCAPGMNSIRAAGGMHEFMSWDRPMLTDSGGFQVFSLAQNQISRLDDTGVYFKQSMHQIMHMNPDISLATQKIIGADIIMAFDQCTPDSCSPAEVERIMHRTHLWLAQSIAYQHLHPNSIYGFPQALFGIIQGGLYADLRIQAAETVAASPVDGIAIGGETIGFNMQKTIEIISWISHLLPTAKPRYTMGVGMSPQDLLDVTAMGIDMFDCVAPTRNARHGSLYVGQVLVDGDWLKFSSDYSNCRLSKKKACFANDHNPISDCCTCYTCEHHSRAYLHHLFKQHAGAFTALASIHNIHVLHDVCARIRNLIMDDALL
ncbi:MAG: tRNA-guanine(34) transglycosylase [Legionellales bacterium RIFCSPHIGHO2_12_FULL_42_9]|nr:MAG: tRNA-guanine(34) transglycosylase [Legionellales bacterium RIFCSPHIGHO2_12_FULL_42_9]